MMSKKFIKSDRKSSLVSELMMQMAKGIVLLWLFLPKKSPSPHFFFFPGYISMYSFIKL